MKPNKEQMEAYKAMAKASPDSMKVKIKAHLVANCPKFAGHEDKFDECIEYVTECAREILKNRPGDVADDACYKMARDFFNDELWEKDEKKPAKKAAQAPDLEMTEPTPDPDSETPAEREETKPAPKPQPGQCSLFDIAGFANA